MLKLRAGVDITHVPARAIRAQVLTPAPGELGARTVGVLAALHASSNGAMTPRAVVEPGGVG